MSVSQNGWAVDASGAGQDRGALIPGIVVPNGVRAGDVAYAFRWLAGQYNARVEKLVPGTCWGWFVKPIEGSSTYSNHASGTAVDFNADRHPMGTDPSKTFSAAQIKACRAIVAETNGVLRWGGDYTGRKDGMHWEINTTAAGVKAFVAHLKGDTVEQADIDKIVAGVKAAIDTAPIRQTDDAGNRLPSNRSLGGTIDADAKRIIQLSTDVAAIKEHLGLS